MEPIKIEDPKLAAKVDRIIEQLKEYYPDGRVIRIGSDHKKLSERIGKVYKEIGYQSRDDFFTAYGFEVVMMKRGHPFTTDAKEVLAELHRRYDGKALCTTTKELIEENPDLKGKLKTLQNNSVKDFGDGFKNILVGEGLLAVKERVAAREFTREEMDEALKDLEGKVKESGNRLTTIADLKKAYPDYARAIAFLPKVCDGWYGAAPSSVLHQRGILAHSYDAEKLIEWLKESYSSRPDNEKPASVEDIISANADRRAELRSAQRTWKSNHDETFFECLKKNGVIRMSDLDLREKFKETAPLCVRNAALDELISLWKRVGGPKALARAKEGHLALPERVLAIDIDCGVEIRRSFFHAVANENDISLHKVKAGMPLSCAASYPYMNFETLDGCLLSNRSPSHAFCPVLFDEYDDYAEGVHKGSSFADLVGAWIENISHEAGGRVLVCIRFDYPHKLTTQTMINLLYKNGVLTDDDMLGGDDWRTREYEKLSFEGAALAEDSGGDSAIGSAPEPEPESGPDSESEPESEVEPASESGPEPEFESEIESESESNGPTREDKLSLARLAVTAAQLVGVATFPQEFLDKLERAEQGDMSIDPDELLKEINDMTPDEHSVDAASLTFDEGRVARGKHFDVAIPDGWHVVENYERDGLFGQKRPFVAVPEHVSNDDIELSNRIIYVDSGDRAVKLGQTSSFMTAPLRWAMFCQAHYVEMANQMTNPTSPFAAFAQKTMWDCEVDAQNTKCFILQYNSGTGINGLEFNIRPYSLDHSDYLRVCLSMDENIDIDAVREVVKRIAATVELDKPFESDAERDLKAAFGKKLTKDEFTDLASRIASPIPNFFQELFTAGQNRYVFQLNGEEVDARDATIAGARMLAEYGEKFVPYYGKLLDIYAANDCFGETKATGHEAYDVLKNIFEGAFPSAALFADDEAKIVTEEGILDDTPEKTALRDRLESLLPEGKANEDEKGETAAASVEEEEQLEKPNEPEVAPLHLEDVLSADLLQEPKRLEENINEVSADELIALDERIVPEILQSRQRRIDTLTAGATDSSSDLEVIRKEAGRYNVVFFELVSRLKISLREMISQSKLDDAQELLDEMNEVLELVSDCIEISDSRIGALQDVTLPEGLPELKRQLDQVDCGLVEVSQKQERAIELKSEQDKIPELERRVKELSDEINKASLFSFGKKRKKEELAQCQAQLDECRSQAALCKTANAEYAEAGLDLTRMIRD